MASTCPNATILLGTPQAPGTPADITTVQTAVVALLGTLAGVSIKTTGADYLVVGPTTGAGRWLLTFGAGAKVIDAAQQYNADVELVAGHVWCGFSYNCTDNDITNPWDGAANPFGASDFSKFFALTSVVATDNIATVGGEALIADGGGLEALYLWFRKNATSVFEGAAGAIVAQNDDDIADAVTARIYGFTATQGVSMASSAWALASNFPGGFSTSTDAALSAVRIGGAWVDMTRSVDVSTVTNGGLTSSTGKKLGLRVPVKDASGAGVGWLRNIRQIDDAIDLAAVNNIAGSPIGVAHSYGTGGATDAFAIATGAP